MADLSSSEVESFINQIVSGGRIRSVRDSHNRDVVLFFSHPMSRDFVMSEYIRETTLQQAKEGGLPSEEEMMNTLRLRGVWSEEKEQEVESLTKQIEAQKVVLSKTTRVPANIVRLRGVIKSLEDKIWDIRKDKETRLVHTCERKAEEERLLFLTWSGIRNVFDNSHYWETFQEFKDCRDFVFRNNVSISYAIFSVGIKNDTVRYIARQPQWRMRFLAAQKNGGKLFSRDVCDYSVDMLNIMYWSHYYSSIYEMMPDEKPDEDIINDDHALDAFMDDYFAEQKTKSDISKSKKNVKGKSAWDHGETIVTQGNPLYKDISYSETLADKLRRKGNTGVVDAPLTSKTK